MYYALAILISYMIGNFNLAHILAKRKGFDIRSRGTHNPGASNAFITLGKMTGVMVGACDIAKAALSVFIAMNLFPDVENIKVVAGVACVMGHMFPITMKFKGGKGFASFLGMTIFISWKYFIAIGIAIILITLITDYIVLGTMTTVISFPIFQFFAHAGFVSVAIISIASIAIIIKHTGNLKRIAKGEEIGFRRVNKTGK